MKQDPEKIGIICHNFDEKFLVVTIDDDKVKTPHFHIIDKKTLGEKFDSRIYIQKCKYVSKKDDRLNDKQIVKLIKMFKTKSKYGPKKFHALNWKWVTMNWDASNKHKLDLAPEMPDYTKLK